MRMLSRTHINGMVSRWTDRSPWKQHLMLALIRQEEIEAWVLLPPAEQQHPWLECLFPSCIRNSNICICSVFFLIQNGHYRSRETSFRINSLSKNLSEPVCRCQVQAVYIMLSHVLIMKKVKRGFKQSQKKHHKVPFVFMFETRWQTAEQTVRHERCSVASLGSWRRPAWVSAL